MSFLLTGLLHLLGPIVPVLPFDVDVAPSEVGATSRSTAPVVSPAAALSPNSVLPQEEPPPSPEVTGIRFKLPPSQQDAAAHDPPAASRQAPVITIKHVPPPSAARRPFWARATAVLRVALAQFEAVFVTQPQLQPVSNSYASNPHGLRQRPSLQGPSLTDALVPRGPQGGPRGVAANRRRQVAAEEASRSRWLRLTSRVGIKPRDGAGRSGLSEVLPSPRRSNGANRQRQPTTAAAAAAGADGARRFAPGGLCRRAAGRGYGGGGFGQGWTRGQGSTRRRHREGDCECARKDLARPRSAAGCLAAAASWRYRHPVSGGRPPRSLCTAPWPQASGDCRCRCGTSPHLRQHCDAAAVHLPSPPTGSDGEPRGHGCGGAPPVSSTAPECGPRHRICDGLDRLG
ncbi:hypothetical protein BU14_0773s0002 [Porphyra umbilicalis]|uniref:Uncharacterized protein n=1 Tax=Porphyra umbilicalis TaxID=2786 RepID=A0A1X6NP35_PORUM|nr:hypothetical protein BU14_0773s0002 [Porphyra umbilicalis]|eukprot:OSX70378.1 hypothetical protein BU14_0773s0002 [Porphyra umbilicalis]